jgi:hypothetical protein
MKSMEDKVSEQMNLKQLERRAYRSTFQDGLWDLYLAGLMACLGILGLIGKFREETWIWLVGYTVLAGSVFGLFMLGKKHITMPRLGAVKFGPSRKRRKLVLVGILSITVLLNVVLVLITAGVISAPAWLDHIQNEMTQRGVMDLLVPLFAGLFVAILMSIVAYFIDYYRGMYIGLVFGLGIFLSEYFDLPVALVVGAVLIAVPGVILLVRFIRQYPIQSNKVEHGTSKTS